MDKGSSIKIQQICQISSLIVLDFSNNSLSGSIPKCLNNISAMVASDKWHNDEYGSLDYNYDYGLYLENLMLMTKGRESEYTKNLEYLRTIDLSSNNLSGSIPTKIFLLPKLQSLNLSQNHLIGKISKDIGSMKSLESLDLSRNHLFGEIPSSMSNLFFLSYLNLSHNHFSGAIPLGTQLQSFDALSYIGNPQLCGDPLPKTCVSLNGTPAGKNDDDYGNSSFYMDM